MSAVIDIENAQAPTGTIPETTQEGFTIKADTFGDPKPLGATYGEWEYPLNALPEPVRSAVIEVRDYIQAPTALIASCALSSVSLAIQSHIDVARDERLIGPVSLYLLTLGDSGERKTTVDGFFTKPIHEWEAKKRQELAREISIFDTESAQHDAKRIGLLNRVKQQAKKGEPVDKTEEELAELEMGAPVCPRIPKLLMTDATPEALQFRLKQYPSGGLISDEGGTVFGGHAMGKDSVMRNLSGLNSVWGGDALRIDRRTKESFVVENPRLTVHIQIQEPTLSKFMEKNESLARGSGFFARFLISQPLSTQGSRLYKEPPANSPHLTAFQNRITEILEEPTPFDEAGNLEPRLMVLSGSAKRRWVEAFNEIEKSLAVGGEFEDVRDFASKAADNAVRLSALFSFLENQTADAPISEKNIEAGFAIVGYHLNEAQRFFSGIPVDELANDSKLLDDWLIDICKASGASQILANDILQKGPNPLRNKDRRDKALRRLIDADRAREWSNDNSSFVVVNPRLLEGQS